MTCRCTMLAMLVLALAAAAQAREEALLDVAQGHIPNDTGSDGLTKFALEEHAGLGRKALKVVFAPGDPELAAG